MNNKDLGRQVGRRIRDGGDAAALVFVRMAQIGAFDGVTVTEHAGLFPEWDEYWRGKAGEIVRDPNDGSLYQSIHDVDNAGQNTSPSETPAMWTCIGDPAKEWPEWAQPIGAHDAYREGAKTAHGGKHWINTYGDGNGWEPGVYGWTDVGEGETYDK
jgi:hypothetical protein